MFHGKYKAVTFSYDDGVLQDIRLIKLFEKYNLKATFNINSARLGESGTLECFGVELDHSRVKAEDLRAVYNGHEVAAHTLTHPNLVAVPDNEEVRRQVEEDRLRLSELMGYEVVGFAYAGGAPNCDERIVDIVRNQTGVRYARTVGTTGTFELPTDLYCFQATAGHEWDKDLALAEAFVREKADAEHPKLFYFYGHSYELDGMPEAWKKVEALCEILSNQKDIFYGTNKEVLLP